MSILVEHKVLTGHQVFQHPKIISVLRHKNLTCGIIQTQDCRQVLLRQLLLKLAYPFCILLSLQRLKLVVLPHRFLPLIFGLDDSLLSLLELKLDSFEFFKGRH
jgi:hypothetical protein